MNKKLIWALLGAVLLAGCQGDSSAPTAKTDAKSDTPATTTPAGGKTIAFVTNNSSDFWTIAQKGTEKAQAELAPKGYKIEFKMPQDGTAATQKQILDDLIANGAVGIAVSAVAPKDQTDELNSVAAKALLFCQDSDAPESNRACYLGTDNVAAGHMAGEELLKALPNGGKVMAFVGKKDAQNAKERLQGVEDAIKGSKVVILDVRTDDTDHARAKQNVADALVTNPDLAGCVGLWSYNGPAIANAVKEAKKEGKVKIVAFDEEADTLAGVKDGTIAATIVQQPFEFGYQSMMLMAKVIDGDKTAIPATKKIIVPTRVISKDNVDEFSAKLKELRGK